MKKLSLINISSINNIKIKSGIIAILVIIVLLWLIWSNVYVEETYYVISSENLPASFNGFKIAHVSDLHNAEFGENNKMLIDLLRDTKPDIIAVTGDSIDNFNTDIEITLDFLKEAMQIAPCYVVTGNHEAWIGTLEFKAFEARMLELGVVVLHNESSIIERNGESIAIVGMDDPDYNGFFLQNLNKFANSDYYTILLSHRPENFENYVNNRYDMVLSGHAHGGQFRLPFIGGLLAPNQGWFPKYDSGIYSKDNTTMIVSRGLGNSIVPIRINNRPELIIIELCNAK